MSSSQSMHHLEERIVQSLRTVYDPEIPVNVYDLGLIYGILIDTDGNSTITMTLTSPNCPASETLPVSVEKAVLSVSGIKTAKVEIVFEPPWNKEMMSQSAMLELGFL
ncbi:MAG TPA: iron-sulfur cluster assembly protein [Bacteroidales bacterium]|nr:iron-sulfur cluster assembly protein [Bacteroidales bacterium]